MTAAAADRWLAKIGEIFAWVWACVWACLPVCVFPKWLTMWVRWPLLKQKALLLVKMFTRHRLPFQVKKSTTNTSSFPASGLSVYLPTCLPTWLLFSDHWPPSNHDAPNRSQTRRGRISSQSQLLLLICAQLGHTELRQIERRLMKSSLAVAPAGDESGSILHWRRR